MVTSIHYVSKFNISRTFKDVSNTLQYFKFMVTMVFETAGRGFSQPVGTKRLGKKRVSPFVIHLNYSSMYH